MKKEESPFVELISNNRGLIHKVCLIYCETGEERKDLFQEIVLQLWRSYGSFRGEAKISTWMYRIGLNTAISGWRKNSKRPTHEELSDHHFNLADSSPDDSEEKVQQLHRAIRQLSEIERAIIMLVLEEVPYDEIASTMGITQNNVRVRMNRIREKLKKLMTR